MNNDPRLEGSGKIAAAIVIAVAGIVLWVLGIIYVGLMRTPPAEH